MDASRAIVAASGAAGGHAPRRVPLWLHTRHRQWPRALRSVALPTVPSTTGSITPNLNAYASRNAAPPGNSWRRWRGPLSADARWPLPLAARLTAPARLNGGHHLRCWERI